MADLSLFKKWFGSNNLNKDATNQLKPINQSLPPSEKKYDTISSDIVYKDFQLPYNKYGSNLDITVDQSIYDPAMVRQIINQPAFFPKWQLYSTMEVQWPKIAKSMDYLKNSVASKKFILKSFDESVDSKKKLDLVQKAQDYMHGDSISNINSFNDMIKNIISSYGMGLCLQQYKWDQVDNFYIPWGTRLISGYLYEYSIPNENIYLKLQGGMEEIDPRLFILSVYKNRSTPNMSTYGMYQSLAMLYSYQNYAKQFLMKLAEKFGIPMVKGTYPNNADDTFKQAFNTLLSNFGNSLYIGGPEGCNIELIESSINASNNPQKDLLLYCDRMADIVLLGNNLTTDSGDNGSRALGSVQAKKENGIIDNLAKFVISNLNNQFIKSILMMNGLTLDNLPYYAIESDPDVDLYIKKLSIIQQIKSLGYVINDEAFMEEAKEFGIIIDEKVEIEEPVIENQPNPIIDKEEKVEEKETE